MQVPGDPVVRLAVGVEAGQNDAPLAFLRHYLTYLYEFDLERLARCLGLERLAAEIDAYVGVGYACHWLYFLSVRFGLVRGPGYYRAVCFSGRDTLELLEQTCVGGRVNPRACAALPPDH